MPDLIQLLSYLFFRLNLPFVLIFVESVRSFVRLFGVASVGIITLTATSSYVSFLSCCFFSSAASSSVFGVILVCHLCLSNTAMRYFILFVLTLRIYFYA